MSVNPEAFAELSAALARYGATSNDVSKALTDVGKALREAKVTPAIVTTAPAIEGELLLRLDWREAGGAFGIGDFVTRDGTDVHRCIDLHGDGADIGVFVCVVAPEPLRGDVEGLEEEPWCKVGETETNLTRRYDPLPEAMRLRLGL